MTQAIFANSDTKLGGSKAANDKSDQRRHNASLSRREFLTYSFGVATTMLAGSGGLLTFSYLMPRFQEGEFGGTIDIGPVEELPQIDEAPQPFADGKFWLVNTEEGPKALYMVCTHLGCLYQWEATSGKFKCPCHGSCFDRDGSYLGGPASRSLDQFSISMESESVVVDTGKKVKGNPNIRQLPICS